MLELIDVSKRFGEITALQPTTLRLQQRRSYVLLGQSGCGKSTLLKIALGLIQPDAGSVRFNSDSLNDENSLGIRRRIGYVIQRGGLFPHLTALENVTLVARYLRWSPDKTNSRIDQLVDLTQVPRETLRRYPSQLSGGQQQRVGLMRALMLDPDLLLMDEPLGALDPIIRSDLQHDLREIFRTLHKTVVIVTHDLQEAAFFADEIVLLRDGRIIQQGTIGDLMNHPSDPFVTRFIRAQRNGIDGEMA